MSELKEKAQKSIERLKAFEPRNGEGYYLAFSGGKDSVVCKALLDMAGVKYDSTYRVTSVDPPELVQYIKNEHPDVKMETPHYENDFYPDGRPMPITMWNLIPKMLIPPTRLARYCCAALKESGGDGKMTVTGVRWAESVNRAKNQGKVTITNARKKDDVSNSPDFKQTNKGGVVLVNDNADSRRMVEQCYKRRKTTVNPIIDWTDREVWEFIRAESIPVCKLYGEGWSRLGCIGCPMARRHGREKQYARWPTYKKAYLTAFGKMLEERIKRGKITVNWTTAQDVFNWWMEYDVLPGQTSLFEDD